MLLSARMLKDVAGVNSYEYDTQVQWTEGDTTTIYFQLIDSSLDNSSQGFQPPGRRFVPAAGATMSVTLENIDDARKLTRLATQPFANDGSIWALQIQASDKIRGTPQLRMTLTQAGVVTSGLVKNALKIHPKSNH